MTDQTAEDPYSAALREMATERGIDPANVPSLKQPDTKDPIFEGVPGFINSMGAGMVDAAFETKDFFFGEPAQQDKSQFRQMHEAVRNELTRDSTVNSLTKSVSQFATGMVGAGKILGPVILRGNGARRKPWRSSSSRIGMRHWWMGQGTGRAPGLLPSLMWSPSTGRRLGGGSSCSTRRCGRSS